MVPNAGVRKRIYSKNLSCKRLIRSIVKRLHGILFGFHRGRIFPLFLYKSLEDIETPGPGTILLRHHQFFLSNFYSLIVGHISYPCDRFTRISMIPSTFFSILSNRTNISSTLLNRSSSFDCRSLMIPTSLIRIGHFEHWMLKSEDSSSFGSIRDRCRISSLIRAVPSSGHRGSRSIFQRGFSIHENEDSE
jgi:hypothetical protein